MATSTKALHSVNPLTGETIASYDFMSSGEIADIIPRVHRAFTEWRVMPFLHRKHLMERAAELLLERGPEYARLMADEMGKPVKDGIAEVAKCAGACSYFADQAERFLEREDIATDAVHSFVTFNPLGVILAVMPWNFPFWQVMRAAAPALMAGNAMVLKHASNVQGCALALEKLFRDAGFPEHLFRTLRIGSDQVNAVIEHPLVRAVTLTGSAEAGRAVAAKAGAMLKKTVLELGGSDPYVILEDADLEQAAEICTRARMVNGGQSCIAGKRFIVPARVRTRFETAMVKRMQVVKMGNPLDEHTTLGPMARHDLRDALHVQVQQSVNRGAKLLLGGAIPGGPGAFYPPTVLTDVRRGMPAYEDELFGPVAAIIPVFSESDAIAVANDSVFGLGGAVLTRDIARGEHIAAEQIESGFVCVNDNVRSDQRLPFGGVKQSGYGRELSAYGIREFVNIKSVSVA